MKPIIATYSPQEVSDLLGIPKYTVLSAIERGELPVIRWNSRVFRITAIDAAAWHASKGGRARSTTRPSLTTLPED